MSLLAGKEGEALGTLVITPVCKRYVQNHCMICTKTCLLVCLSLRHHQGSFAEQCVSTMCSSGRKPQHPFQWCQGSSKRQIWWPHHIPWPGGSNVRAFTRRLHFWSQSFMFIMVHDYSHWSVYCFCWKASTPSPSSARCLKSLMKNLRTIWVKEKPRKIDSVGMLMRPYCFFYNCCKFHWFPRSPSFMSPCWLKAYTLYALLSYARRYWRKAVKRGTKGEARACYRASTCT